MNATIYDNETIKGVIEHMNEDHHDACLTIAQALGDSPNAIKATMLGMDSSGVEFSTESNDGQMAKVRVTFSKPITRESQIRGHLVALTKQARALQKQQQ